MALREFPEPWDPNENKDYVRDWSAEMEALSDEINVANFILPTEATAVGMQVTGISKFDSNKKVRFFVSSTDPAATAAALSGQSIQIVHDMTTSAGRIYQEVLSLQIIEEPSVFDITLTVEDGTGVDGADSYATLIQIEEYLNGRPQLISTWDLLSETTKVQAARMATRHLDYSYNWRGIATYDDQVLSWPRSGVLKRTGLEEYLDTDIPEELIWAEAELAFQWSQADQLMPSGEFMTQADARSVRGGVIKEKLGPLERWYTEEGGYLFALANGYAPFQKTYPLLDLYLRHLTTGGSFGDSFRRILI